ncbi:hypothetical protein PV10_06377 [Exophiala mesophila]|uniref:Uncharacterized protein n=1 Tax=Exophiala mesophila TaxID=212818 RepID=A0A0D1XUK4_EXOME|nr:uncharacterized protein PV10_06377 [Exophiala mesophila]KIV91886.1 hypothetical protein PV10_06377 [Exophiala mesophila]
MQHEAINGGFLDTYCSQPLGEKIEDSVVVEVPLPTTRLMPHHNKALSTLTEPRDSRMHWVVSRCNQAPVQAGSPPCMPRFSWCLDHAHSNGARSESRHVLRLLENSSNWQVTVVYRSLRRIDMYWPPV